MIYRIGFDFKNRFLSVFICVHLWTISKILILLMF